MIYDETTTVADALSVWDRGEPIWSVEMGGLGPGYEQCIQLLAVELLREYDGKRLPEKSEDWRTWGDEVARRVNDQVGGFSGAQVDAAKNVAARMLKLGYGAALQDMKGHDPERLIQVSNNWPRLAARGA